MANSRPSFSGSESIVTRLGETPLFLAATTKDFEPKAYAEFIAYAKVNPGKVHYASVGVGSAGYRIGEEQSAGIQAVKGC
jgi:tripartite-type tricarboxylate transporter receptor subunit TctC